MSNPLSRLLLALCAVFSLSAAACGDDDATETTDDAATDDAAADDDAASEADGDDPDAATDDEDSPSPDDEVEPEELGTVLQAELSGEAEVPGPGAEGATGAADVTIDDGEVCVVATTTGLPAPPVGGHIHDGGADEAGPIVVDFTSVLTSTGIDGCVEAPDDVITDITDDPDGYYVNIHTPELPDGAVRGQLQPGV